MQAGCHYRFLFGISYMNKNIPRWKKSVRSATAQNSSQNTCASTETQYSSPLGVDVPLFRTGNANHISSSIVRPNKLRISLYKRCILQINSDSCIVMGGNLTFEVYDPLAVRYSHAQSLFVTDPSSYPWYPSSLQSSEVLSHGYGSHRPCYKAPRSRMKPPSSLWERAMLQHRCVRLFGSHGLDWLHCSCLRQTVRPQSYRERHGTSRSS